LSRRIFDAVSAISVLAAHERDPGARDKFEFRVGVVAHTHYLDEDNSNWARCPDALVGMEHGIF